MHYGALEWAGWPYQPAAVMRPRSTDVPGGEAAADDLFLPDFCAIGTLFSVVLTGALLAFVLVHPASGADASTVRFGNVWCRRQYA